MKKLVIILYLVFIFNSINVYAINYDIVKFKKCVDGDTAVFILNNEEIKVRFLAIDTPETVHPNKEVDSIGLQASDFTCSKLRNAQEIKLEYDSNSDKFDKYNRLLAWIWVDNILLQKELINNGYAKIKYIYGDYKYLEDLSVSEKISKNEKIGIWNSEPIIYEIKFKVDNEIIIKNINENEKINYFIPYKKGYTFIKWNYNNKEFDFNTKINKNIELVAIFEKNMNLKYILIILFIIYIINNKKINKKLKK